MFKQLIQAGIKEIYFEESYDSRNKEFDLVPRQIMESHESIRVFRQIDVSKEALEMVMGVSGRIIHSQNAGDFAAGFRRTRHGRACAGIGSRTLKKPVKGRRTRPERRRWMKILAVEKFSEDQLIERLREVTMLKAPEVKVYSRTFISLEKISPASLSPPQNYILREELKKVRDLKWSLEEHEVDLFTLNGFVRLILEGSDEPVDLLPPIVEESIERDGTVHLIVNDGMHRVYMALREWVIPQVVLVRGVPKDLPYLRVPCSRRMGSS